MRTFIALLLAFALTGCPEDGPGDGGMDASCSLDVEIGGGDRDTFAPFVDGAPQEVLLGFQGFRMLEISVRVEGSPAADAELSVFLDIDDSDVEVSQVHRGLMLAPTSGGDGVIEGYLIFFNDAPASAIVGHTASLEIITRSGGCVGTDVLAMELRDDDMCVSDAGIADVGILDGAIPDGAAACGDGG